MGQPGWYRDRDVFLDGRMALEGMSAQVSEPIAPTAQSCLKISLVTDGGADSLIGGRPMRVEAGQLVVLRPGVQWASRPQGQIAWSSVLVAEPFLKHLLDPLFPDPLLMPEGKHPATWTDQAVVVNLEESVFTQVERAFAELAAVSREGRALQRLSPSPIDMTAVMRARLFLEGVEAVFPQLVEGRDLRVLVGADGHGSAQAPNGMPWRMLSPGVRRVLAAVGTDLGHRWSLASLARVAGLSTSQLERVFRRDLRVTPMEYVRQVRLREFRRLLVQTSDPIAVIAREVGWGSETVAARWFKQTWDASPRVYRAAARLAAQGHRRS